MITARNNLFHTKPLSGLYRFNLTLIPSAFSRLEK
jgi:hypothetical protein